MKYIQRSEVFSQNISNSFRHSGLEKSCQTDLNEENNDLSNLKVTLEAIAGAEYHKN